MEDGEWTWGGIVAFIAATGILSGAVSTAISGGIEWYRGRDRRKSERQFIALFSAVALEEFALRCANLAEEILAGHESYGQINADQLPPPPVYPADCDWRLMDLQDTEDLMSFLNAIKMLQADANYARLFENNPWALQTNCIKLGRRARTLANDLRAKYGLPEKDYLSPVFERLDKILPAPQ